MTQQPGNFTDVGVKGRPMLDPNEKSFSVAIDWLKKGVMQSHGIEPDMKAIQGYVGGAELPDGAFGTSDTAAELVATWNKAIDQRLKELKAMNDVVLDLPDRLARTVENYLNAEEETEGEIDYFNKFEGHFDEQLKDYSAEWSADPGWTDGAGSESGTGSGADGYDDGGSDGGDVPDMNEVP